MAAGVLAEPGTEYGPCTDPCEHIDCAETRRMAAGKCRLCWKPIGYGRRFYVDPVSAGTINLRYVHASCFETESEGR
jgi:hypothetical protein